MGAVESPYADVDQRRNRAAAIIEGTCDGGGKLRQRLVAKGSGILPFAGVHERSSGGVGDVFCRHFGIEPSLNGGIGGCQAAAAEQSPRRVGRGLLVYLDSQV